MAISASQYIFVFISVFTSLSSTYSNAIIILHYFKLCSLTHSSLTHIFFRNIILVCSSLRLLGCSWLLQPTEVFCWLFNALVKLLDWGEEGHRTEAEIASLRAAFKQEVAVWHKLEHPNVTKVTTASLSICLLVVI